MQTAIRSGGGILGVVVGGTIGGLIGWTLGDFGGRSDPENVWFISLVVGAAVGLGPSQQRLFLRRGKGLGWGSSLVVWCSARALSLPQFLSGS